MSHVNDWPPELLIKAGADPRLIPGWIEEGHRRAGATRGIPYTGGW